MIAPAPEDTLAAREVSPAVNRVANDAADLIEPFAAAAAEAPAPERKPKTDSRQGSLF
jgi:hypothetical protein